MVYIKFDKIKSEDKRRTQRIGNCRKFFGVVDGERCVFLETDKVDGEELEERDKKEILKLGDLLKSQAPRNRDELNEFYELDDFDIGRVYMYIMLKAKEGNDTNFLNWWLSYNFKISKYEYNYRDIYVTIGTGTGTRKLVG